MSERECAKIQMLRDKNVSRRALTKKAKDLRPGNSLRPCVETHTFYGVGKEELNKDCLGRNSRLANRTFLCGYLARIAAFVVSGGRPV